MLAPARARARQLASAVPIPGHVKLLGVQVGQTGRHISFQVADDQNTAVAERCKIFVNQTLHLFDQSASSTIRGRIDLKPESPSWQ